MRLPVNRLAPLGVFVALAACGTVMAEPLTVRIAPAGPAADYPMTLGEQFAIDGTTYKPTDVMNYDAVGFAAVETDAGERITGAHKTLPLPSYVEVTSLDSGKTILVRLERRGPMTNDRLVGLSAGAVAQLGLASTRPAIRVRRVNPPEPERSALRTGGRVPERMATPKPLLAALLRKLDKQNGAETPPVALPTTAAAPTSAPAPGAAATPRARRPLVPMVKDSPQAAATPVGASTPPPAPSPAAPVRGNLTVQVAAFSTKARADTVVAKLGGAVTPAGRLWRVRLGPFSTQAAADAALAKARRAGYSDARIQRAD